jgi:peptide/nickel transport system permease protein
MIKQAYDKGAFTSGLYWWIIPPGLCIVLMVLAFSFVGHSLDEILNPRLRERK